MYTGMLHTHTLVIGLYVIIFLVKVILLLAGQTGRLEAFRKRTRLAEMILPTLFLITGIALAVMSPYASQPWFITKMVMIILAIVFGILTFKRNSKILGILTLLIFVYIISLSYTKSPDLQPRIKKLTENAEQNNSFDPAAADYNATAHGAYLYKNLACIDCHGEDGTRKAAGASDLQASKLQDDAIKQVIHQGRKNMPAFSTLKEEELNALATYVKSLRK